MYSLLDLDPVFTSGPQPPLKSQSYTTWALKAKSLAYLGQIRVIILLSEHRAVNSKTGTSSNSKRFAASMGTTEGLGVSHGRVQCSALAQEIRQYYTVTADKGKIILRDSRATGKRFVVSSGVQMSSNLLPVATTTNFLCGAGTIRQSLTLSSASIRRR